MLFLLPSLLLRLPLLPLLLREGPSVQVQLACAAAQLVRQATALALARVVDAARAPAVRAAAAVLAAPARAAAAAFGAPPLVPVATPAAPPRAAAPSPAAATAALRAATRARCVSAPRGGKSQRGCAAAARRLGCDTGRRVAEGAGRLLRQSRSRSRSRLRLRLRLGCGLLLERQHRPL
jgi:hypothetical protein